MATPHRVVDSIFDGIASGAKGLISAGSSAVKGAGSSLMNALDKPFAAITGKEGPHRIVDRAANGAADTVTNFVDDGIIGGMQSAGESLMRALDQPPEQIGLPPDIERTGLGLFKR